MQSAFEIAHLHSIVYSPKANEKEMNTHTHTHIINERIKIISIIK